MACKGAWIVLLQAFLFCPDLGEARL
jgi:hypothetical protein